MQDQPRSLEPAVRNAKMSRVLVEFTVWWGGLSGGWPYNLSRKVDIFKSERGAIKNCSGKIIINRSCPRETGVHKHPSNSELMN